MLFLLLLNFSTVYAFDPIPITFSGTIDQVRFDGKWSFESEWKQSSLNNYYFDNGNVLVILRTAHQGDHVYVFIDMINDETLDRGEDRATVCFDSNNKNVIPDSDDHCFTAILDSGIGATYRGDNSSLQQIQNHSDYVGLSSASDENDRYSGVPHPGYEFRIPTEVIGRNWIYGFYFEVYDKNTDRLYTYPQANLSMSNNPSMWGEIYSPDKSLPEFDLPALMLLPTLGIVIIITRQLYSKN